jgi:hypothetical protein
MGGDIKTEIEKRGGGGWSTRGLPTPAAPPFAGRWPPSPPLPRSICPSPTPRCRGWRREGVSSFTSSRKRPCENNGKIAVFETMSDNEECVILKSTHFTVFSRCQGFSSILALAPTWASGLARPSGSIGIDLSGFCDCKRSV